MTGKTSWDKTTTKQILAQEMGKFTFFGDGCVRRFGSVAFLSDVSHFVDVSQQEDGVFLREAALSVRHGLRGSRLQLSLFHGLLSELQSQHRPGQLSFIRLICNNIHSSRAAAKLLIPAHTDNIAVFPLATDSQFLSQLISLIQNIQTRIHLQTFHRAHWQAFTVFSFILLTTKPHNFLSPCEQ